MYLYLRYISKVSSPTLHKSLSQNPPGIGQEGRTDQRDRGSDQQGEAAGGGSGAEEAGGQEAAGETAEGIDRQVEEARGPQEALQVQGVPRELRPGLG